MYKFIGLINPPERESGYWGIIYEVKTDRYFAAPLSPYLNSFFDYYHSEPHESLASFMYMLHGTGKDKPNKSNELIIACSYREALKRWLERLPEEENSRLSMYAAVGDLQETVKLLFDNVNSTKAIKAAIDHPDPRLTDEESIYV